MRSPRPLDDEQMAVVLEVLRFNHDYYMAQGMSRAHMWPEELAHEIQNGLRQARRKLRSDTTSGGPLSFLEGENEGFGE